METQKKIINGKKLISGKSWLSYKGKIGRGAFILRTLMVFPLIFIFGTMMADIASPSLKNVAPIIFGIFLFLCYFFAVQVVKRLHDLGYPGRSILLCIPWINVIYLLIAKGNPYDNKYGKAGKTTVEVNDNSQNTDNEIIL